MGESQGDEETAIDAEKRVVSKIEWVEWYR